MEGNGYRFLRVSSRIFEVLSWIALVLGVVFGLIILIGGGGPDAPRVAGFFGFLMGGVYFLIFKTVGGVLRLLLDIESHMKP